MSNPKITTEVIGPDDAKEILEKHNDQNRTLAPKSVEKYARAMTDGRWQFVGDPIRFDRSGELLDGQHRLAAVVASGIPQTFVIVRNLEPETQQFMDMGRKRSAADQLRIDGISHPRESAMIATLVMHWRTKDIHMNTNYSAFEIVEFTEANSNAVESAAAQSLALYRATRASKQVAGAMYFMAAEASGAGTAAEFFELLRSGAGLDSGSPVLVLRNKLIYWASSSVRKPERVEQLYYYVRCWNGWRRGEQLERLQLPRGTQGTIRPSDLELRS